MTKPEKLKATDSTRLKSYLGGDKRGVRVSTSCPSTIIAGLVTLTKVVCPSEIPAAAEDFSAVTCIARVQ